MKGIFFKKCMKFARTENKKSLVPKHLGTLKKKKLPLFDKFLHQTISSFKGMRFCPMFECKYKKEFEKLIE